MHPLSESAIGAAFREHLSVQNYTPSPTIAGVEVTPLRLMTDDGGVFTELLRVDGQGNMQLKPELRLAQVNFSRVLPGAIKAFHLHLHQEDVWFVPPEDRLLLGMVDVREDSPTYQQRMRMILGGGHAKLVCIPRGVAHGVANLWNTPGQIIYFINDQFSLDQPDELRLPWDLCGADFWTIQPG